MDDVLLYVAVVPYQIISYRMLMVCELELFSPRTTESLSHSYDFEVCLNTEKTEVPGTTARGNRDFVCHIS